MNFFEVNARQDFAGYCSPEVAEGADKRNWKLLDLFKPKHRSEPLNGGLAALIDSRVVGPNRDQEILLEEYLGEPPRKPGKRGDLHRSANGLFVRPAALTLFESASRGRLVISPTTIIGREDEDFKQIWVLNFVDCLDVAKTVASPTGGFYKGKIGVIKRPVFDENRWDGSDLFVVPEDPSFCLFCSENFVQQWKAAKLKGAMFARFLMDPDSIIC